MAKNKNGGAKAGSEQAAKKSGILTSPIRNMLVTAIVCAALGVAFLVQPAFVRDYCGFVIGGLICLIGLIYIVMYFCRKQVSGIYRSEFALGAIALAAGVYVILASLRPDATGISITLWLIVTALGVLIAVDGILKLQYTLDLARMHFGGWWAGLVVSLLGIALGVLVTMGVVVNLGVRLHLGPDDFTSAMMLLGVAFCCNAVLDLITLILVAVRNRKAAKAEAAAAAAEAAAAADPGARSRPRFLLYPRGGERAGGLRPRGDRHAGSALSGRKKESPVFAGLLFYAGGTCKIGAGRI